MLIKVLIAIIASYLLGTLLFAYIITKMVKGEDIRTLGSGNAGFTNALRVLPKPFAFLVFFLDMAKGIIAVRLSMWLVGDPGCVIGLLMVIVGHTFPFWLGFKGGKGIAAGFGGLIGCSPILAACLLVIWAIVTLVSNHVSLGSIVVVAVMPFIGIAIKEPWYFILLLFVLAVLVIWLHRGNISRLRAGTESKLFKNR